MKKVLTLLLFLAGCSVGINAQTETVYGDVNGDGFVSAADVTEVYNVLLGNMPNMTKYIVNGVAFNMVDVEGGIFMMGATSEQGSDIYDDEKPVHEVTLSRFSIGQTEVTQELWVAVMGSNPSWFNGTGNPDYVVHEEDYGVNLQRPVEWVTWDDCQEFITKLNQMTGKNFRLPTEAEWEYAARGGSRSHGFKYAGSDNVYAVAWYDGNAYYVGSSSPDYGTHTVATKDANELGLYDMSGNVMEYCQDFYGREYYSVSPSYSPQGPESGYSHVRRGGCWRANTNNCRISRRSSIVPNETDNMMGLRLAL